MLDNKTIYQAYKRRYRRLINLVRRERNLGRTSNEEIAYIMKICSNCRCEMIKHRRDIMEHDVMT